VGEQFLAEGAKSYKALAFAPRYTKDSQGFPQEPVVTIDIRWGKAPAGCLICDQPIPKETTRIEFWVLLREPVKMGDKERRHERYFAHPGCLTEKVRPEILRSRMSCYDCGREPPQASGVGLIHWGSRCYTVSKFASAPICGDCTEKPRWKMCDACVVYFPHWMISETAESRDYVPPAHLSQYADLAVREHQNICEFCAKRLRIPTVDQAEDAKQEFERLRREIAEQGIWNAGDH